MMPTFFPPLSRIKNIQILLGKKCERCLKTREKTYKINIALGQAQSPRVGFA